MTTGPVVAGGLGGQVLRKRADSNMTDWVDASALGHEKIDADRTYFVSNTGSDDNDGLSADYPFGSIQAALDAVAQLDVDHRHIVTVQLADGIYTTGPNSNFSGLNFVDPVNSKSRGFPDQGTCHAILRGNPSAPQNVIIDIGISSFAGLVFSQSTAWAVYGVRLQYLGDVSAFGTFRLVQLFGGSFVQLDVIDFHIATPHQGLVTLADYSRLWFGMFGGTSRLTKSGTGSINIAFELFAYSQMQLATGAFDCQHTAIVVDSQYGTQGIWYVAAHGSLIADHSEWTNSENITGGQQFQISEGSTLWHRHTASIPGDAPGIADSTSRLLAKNHLGSTPSEAIPIIDPVGGPLMGFSQYVNLYQLNYKNGKTIVNAGAAAMVQYELPGWENFAYSVANGTNPFGLRYGFVVHSSFGIRVSASAGMSIRYLGNVGGKIESTEVGASLVLLNVSKTEWIAIAVVGTWAVMAQATNTVAPTVSPTTAAPGAPVTCSPGTWSSTPAKLFYQWLVDGVEDSSLSLNGIVNPTIAQLGTLTCRVSMIDTAGVGSVSVLTSNSCTITGAELLASEEPEKRPPERKRKG